MKIPFIKVNQKGETFYISKLNAFELRKYVNFEFRDPYIENSSKSDIIKNNEYMNRINKECIRLNNNPKGVQRRIQIDKINSIKNYLEYNADNFFPNSVILSLNIKEESLERIHELEEKEVGEFSIEEGDYFNIIDGQHRLAGIFMCSDDIVRNFDIPVVLLIDISISSAIKIFLDINSNQKKVDKSLVYDLYEDLDNNEINDIKKIHTICQKLYINSNSPLYRQIKMLGVGNGAISQAFFIDTVIANTKFLDISTQDMYSHLFSYFRAYQRVFPNDWPAKLDSKNMSIDELDDYAKEVLVKNKSQLLKTTGFGAIMNVFEYIYNKSNGDYNNYYEIVLQLKNKINWRNISGTGKSKQRELSSKIVNILEGRYDPMIDEVRSLIQNLAKIESLAMINLINIGDDDNKNNIDLYKNNIDIQQLLEKLKANSILGEDDIEMVTKTQQIRNFVVHNREVQFEEIQEAINLQNIIIQKLEKSISR